MSDAGAADRPEAGAGDELEAVIGAVVPSHCSGRSSVVAHTGLTCLELG